MTTSWIGLGGNVGDVSATFDAALAELQAQAAIDVVARSGVHRTAAVGERAGEPFWNMAAGVETELDPYALLNVLHAVERRFGRTREVYWGPRTLDLDLLFHGDAVIGDDRLVVPHPAAWYRRFVLAPLAEIAPNLVHPVRGESIASLLQRIERRPLRLGLIGGTNEQRHAIAARLFETFDRSELSIESDREPGGNTATILAWLGSSTKCEFDTLPITSRLDVATRRDSTTFLRDVIASALG